MFLEYDWTYDAYRPRLGDGFPSITRSFETLAAARHALRLVGLRLGVKTDPRTWQVEYMVADGDPIPRSHQGWELTGGQGKPMFPLKTSKSVGVWPEGPSPAR